MFILWLVVNRTLNSASNRIITRHPKQTELKRKAKAKWCGYRRADLKKETENSKNFTRKLPLILMFAYVGIWSIIQSNLIKQERKMAKTFYPRKSVLIPASPPHPENTEYKISSGLEHWGDENHDVLKVQMVYNGTVSGRRSPSYPIGTDDFERVTNELQKLN